MSQSRMSDEQPIVFVIDDDQSVREALQGLIRTVGLDVRTFASTADFLEADRPDKPSCLVLDVRLPGLSGLDFQSELAKSDAEFPIMPRMFAKGSFCKVFEYSCSA